MVSLKQFATILFLFVLAGCSPQSKRAKIIGSWEIIPSKNMQEMQSRAAALGLPFNKIVLRFKRDSSMQSVTKDGNKEIKTNSGTYAMSENERELYIYREGNQDRKNTAGIIEITSSKMILTDASGSGDKMYLKKINE